MKARTPPSEARKQRLAKALKANIARRKSAKKAAVSTPPKRPD